MLGIYGVPERIPRLPDGRLNIAQIVREHSRNQDFPQNYPTLLETLIEAVKL